MRQGRLGASFRDPSGFLFIRDGILYRQVNRAYARDYDRLMESGLYERLVKAGFLVPHTEVDVEPMDASRAYKVIRPERIPFVSYPYEWTFGQLRDAARLTLTVQKSALRAGMSLKDASAYNVQFVHGRPMLIDTLSFEVYREGEPWVAYRQFCQHFLAPLALMAYRDVRLGQLLRIYIDGVPLDLASRLLPRRTYLRFGLLAHIHLHAGAQRRYADKDVDRARLQGKMSRQSLLNLIESLRSALRGLRWKPGESEWSDYYDRTNYTVSAFEHKKHLVARWVEMVKPSLVWDLGANTGVFSRLASERGAYTVAFDVDAAAVERNYRQVKRAKERNLLPLVLDLTNPSPAMGWHHRERHSLVERGPADLVLALALIHHLAISNNVPLEDLAEFFYDLGKYLIIEFVPKKDSQVQKLLRRREDIFDQYRREEFERLFSRYFLILQKEQVNESLRWLYLMERRS
ncbi:MAG: SAM-dependent methyltransferase [Anaerolineae bacterium]|nr:MAG: SAM-dependent methyltransferase [Anaerolineae bacterium]